MNQYLRINHNSEVPKYKQVEQLIVSDIESGIFKQGQRVPSINETSEELLLSRDTVEKAYVNLKKKGILSSVTRERVLCSSDECAQTFKSCSYF